jgi:hypothetical protein
VKWSSQKTNYWLSMTAFMLGVPLTVGQAAAQRVNGVAGPPSPATTIEGKQLLPPSPKFGGIINESADPSTRWWVGAACSRNDDEQP